MSGFIYAIECGGRIKIGHSSNPKLRFNKIASDAPFPCTFIGQWEGSVADEQTIHQRFASIRCYREWFAATDELKGYLASIAKAGIGTRRWEISPDDTPIAKWRKARRMTQSELAERIGVVPSVVSRWEAGKSLPRLGRIAKLRHATELDFDEIIGPALLDRRTRRAA
jgi:DNA-binding XRE family transcriptional regulator